MADSIIWHLTTEGGCLAHALPPLGDADEVAAVLGLEVGLRQAAEVVGGDPALGEGDLLGQPILKFCRSSMVRTKLPASSRLAWVPVSSQAKPRPIRSTLRSPSAR